jgi:nucleoside-diphosphate-sugar epimerase
MKKINKCLVTGGAGFIGSHLVKKLLEEGVKVTVVDDLSEGTWSNLPKHKNLKKYKVSILKNMSPFVKRQDVIFHLAAIPRLQRSVDEPLKTHKVNVDGTFNLLLEAKKHRVKKFIFASSSSVYGNRNKTPFKENMNVDPLVPYSLHKVIGEQYCQMFSNLWGLETVSLRYFSVYGPNMNPNSPYALLIPKFLKMMKQNKRPTINGDGTHSRDFTYVTDVVEATILAAKSNLSGEIINIGAGKSTSVNKVFNTLNKILNKKIKPIYGPEVAEPKKTLAENSRAKKILGWKPKLNFGEGIKKASNEVSSSK